MNKSKILWITLGITAAALGLGFAWVELGATQQAEARIVEIAGKRSALNAHASAVRQRIEAAAKSEDDFKAALTEARSRSPGMPRPTPAQNLAALLEAHPELRALRSTSFRANLALTYLPLFDSLKLSPPQIEKFKDLLTEREEERLDLQSTAQSQGLPMSDPAIAALRQQQDDKLHSDEVELLGDAGAQAAQQFVRMQPLENPINDMASFVAHTATPLTAPQAEQLLNVLAASSSQFQAGGTANPQNVDWPAALATAKTFLTPAQYAALSAESQLPQVFKLSTQFFKAETAQK